MYNIIIKNKEVKIKIYPEWNVNLIERKYFATEIKIKIYPEWNVNFLPITFHCLYHLKLKSIQSGM